MRTNISVHHLFTRGVSFTNLGGVIVLKVASLFAGVGGLDYGFENNFDMVFANEFDKNACQTYRTNFNSPPYLQEGDIVQFLDKIPDHDVLIGGVPCTPFSLAGLRKGFEDRKAGNLFFITVDILQTKQPSFFFLENVKGILSHDKGNTLRIILEKLRAVGYRVHHQLFNLSDFGIPQRRERVIFFGVRNDVTIDPKTLVPSPTHKGLILNDVLDLVTGPFGVNNHNLHISTSVKQHWMRVLEEGENLKNIPIEEIRRREIERGLVTVEKIPKSQNGYRRLDGTRIAPTMAFGNSCLPIHPKENRNLSVREAALIQGFPMDFVFKGGISAQYKQVGNAVPPIFSQILANRLFDVCRHG